MVLLSRGLFISNHPPLIDWLPLLRQITTAEGGTVEQEPAVVAIDGGADDDGEWKT